MATVTELIDYAIDLSDEERYTEAVTVLNRVISMDPDIPQAYFERGMAYLNLEKDSDAAADFDRALFLDPNFPGARDWRSRVAESLGDFRRAADERLQNLRSNPDGPHKGMGVSPQEWADCANALMNAGEHGDALRLLEEFVSAHAHKVTSYVFYETSPMRVLAKLLLDTGRIDDALRYAQMAYSSAHKVPTDILIYALVLESASRLEEALAICNEALAENDQMPGLRELHSRLIQADNGL